jgi:hypothetical protein
MILNRLTDAVDWIGSSVSAGRDRLGEISADVFFGTLTSYPSIALFGLVAAAGFAIANLPLANRLPVIGPYVRAAGVVSIVASAALMFAFGYRVADGRAEIERLKSDLAWAEFNVDVQRQVAETADQLKQQAEAEKSEAKGRLNEYETRFGPNPSDPPPGVVDWLRSLQRHPERRAGGADQPKRDIVARVRAAGAKRQ